MKECNKCLLVTFNRYKGRCLTDCYIKPSATKIKIWADLLFDMSEKGGHDLTVLSYNTYMFTAGYTYTKDGKLFFRYFSPSYVRDFEAE